MELIGKQAKLVYQHPKFEDKIGTVKLFHSADKTPYNSAMVILDFEGDLWGEFVQNCEIIH